MNILNNVPVGDAVPEVMISHISMDSREIHAKGLFIAATGHARDGRDFIAQAINQGAAAIIFDSTDGKEISSDKVPVIGIVNLRTHLGTIANNFYDSPSFKLTVCGITGTNGKTTVAHLLATILNKENKTCALIGTLGNGFPGMLEPSVNTTPDVISLHRQMADFFQMGARFICMEVSSHALVQGRVDGIDFNFAVFTNLSHEHLDYHKSMEAYAEAKAGLFNSPGISHCIINSDDPYGKKIIGDLLSSQKNVNVISYGLGSGDISAELINSDKNGLSFHAVVRNNKIRIESQLLGKFNVYNLLAVLACLLETGISLEEAARSIAVLKPIAGRMEKFTGSTEQPMVIVDYAHTPDALEKALLAVREHSTNMIWCVFGCGGDRDKEKRPLMGQVASKLADFIILTNDNPRTESPEEIITGIKSGMSSTPKVIYDREDAIRYAITNAGNDDVVLIAGKGHETYQQIGDRKIAFSDREVVSEMLRQAA